MQDKNLKKIPKKFCIVLSRETPAGSRIHAASGHGSRTHFSVGSREGIRMGAEEWIPVGTFGGIPVVGMGESGHFKGSDCPPE
jgi:hypothetical protein